MIAKFLSIGAVVFVIAAAWNVGSVMSTEALGLALGIIFGMMAGVPAILIAVTATTANQTVRHEHQHTHRVIAETPAVPQIQPVVMIEEKPKRFIVLNDKPKLPISRGLLEVKR